MTQVPPTTLSCFIAADSGWDETECRRFWEEEYESRGSRPIVTVEDVIYGNFLVRLAIILNIPWIEVNHVSTT